MNKKRLLFISVGFHDYATHIVEHLKNEYEVWYLCCSKYYHERPYTQWLADKFPRLIPNLNERHICKFIENTKDCDFDIIFTIKGSNLTEAHLSKLKEYHPRALFKLYVWDEWSVMTNGKILLKYYPQIYTFDSEDSKKYGYTLRPLFYIDSANEDKEKRYDISFVGGGHSNRLQTMAKLRELCEKNDIRYRFVISSTKSTVLRMMFKDYSFYKRNKDLIKIGGIPYNEYVNITRSSKAVIDIPFNYQSGLTARTIEALAVGAKVITTNKHIKEYENISPSVYYIWDMNVDQELINFIKTCTGDVELDKNYSIDNFLKEILS